MKADFLSRLTADDVTDTLELKWAKWYWRFSHNAGGKVRRCVHSTSLSLIGHRLQSGRLDCRRCPIRFLRSSEPHLRKECLHIICFPSWEINCLSAGCTFTLLKRMWSQSKRLDYWISALAAHMTQHCSHIVSRDDHVVNNHAVLYSQLM